MKLLFILLILIGCNDRNAEGLNIEILDRACVDGYIYFYSYGEQHGGSYMSPKFDIDGKLISCSMDKVEKK